MAIVKIILLELPKEGHSLIPSKVDALGHCRQTSIVGGTHSERDVCATVDPLHHGECGRQGESYLQTLKSGKRK